jgi:hypothetical protein
VRGNAQPVEGLDLVRDHPHDRADRVTLLEDVHAEAGQAGDAVRDVQLEAVLEGLPLALREDPVDRLAQLVGRQRRVPRKRHKLPVDAHGRRQAAGQVQVGAPDPCEVGEHRAEIQRLLLLVGEQPGTRVRGRSRAGVAPVATRQVRDGAQQVGAHGEGRAGAQARQCAYPLEGGDVVGIGEGDDEAIIAGEGHRQGGELSGDVAGQEGGSVGVDGARTGVREGQAELGRDGPDDLCLGDGSELDQGLAQGEPPLAAEARGRLQRGVVNHPAADE